MQSKGNVLEKEKLKTGQRLNEPWRRWFETPPTGKQGESG